MKIMHLSATSSGGAGIAAKRIVEAVNTYTDADAYLLTHKEFGTVPDCSAPPFFFRVKGKIESIVLSCCRTDNHIFHSLGMFGSGLVDFINHSDADIVHLHWINDQFLSIRDIAKIKKKIIWTQHDSWAFCGAEHHPDIVRGDKRFQEGYSSDNLLSGSRGIDLDKLIFLWKKYCWKDQKFNFSAPSIWEADLLKKSYLFHSCDCAVIPNCVNTDCFVPQDKTAARKKWDLPFDRPVILFGAVSLQDKNKGSQYLLEAVKKLNKSIPDFLLVCFGKGDMEIFTEQGIDCITVGSVHKDEQLSSLYNAADVFVCPSIVENLPNTCVEASACGIPVSAFRTGGIPDVVQHQETGFLASPFDTGELAEGIGYCLAHKDTLGAEARKHVLKNFSMPVAGEKFYKLYEQILQESAG